MARTVPNMKTIVFSSEDTYRKEKMINYLKGRKMLSASAEQYIKKGKR